MYSIEEVKTVLAQCGRIVEDHQEALTEIDSKTGDGDLGVSMVKGIHAIEETIAGYTAGDIGAMLAQCGMAFNRAAPSTMGTLLGMGMASLGRLWRGKEVLTQEDLVQGARDFVEAIARIGKAKRGSKTILDALYPFVDKLEDAYHTSGDFAASYQAALTEARAGMEATKGMIAKVGRARWLGERAMDTYDGGAMLCVFVLEDLWAEVEGERRIP